MCNNRLLETYLNAPFKSVILDVITELVYIVFRLIKLFLCPMDTDSVILEEKQTQTSQKLSKGWKQSLRMVLYLLAFNMPSEGKIRAKPEQENSPHLL